MFQKGDVEKIKTYFMFNDFLFLKKIRATYEEIRCQSTVEPGIRQMATWRMRIACWIPKATYKLRICNIIMYFLTAIWL